MNAAYDYTPEDIGRALRAIGCAPGDVLFIHANIGFFGRLAGATLPADYYRAFKNALVETIGPAGTFVVPTFSYSFCRNQPFDVATTPGVCGVLSEQVRLDPEAVRANEPNFSVAAIGAAAGELTRDPPANPFGPDGFWARFMDMGGKICNFNFDVGSTFVHFVERSLNVPYRYDKPFPGRLRVGDAWQDKVFYHFVIDLDRKEHYPDFEWLHATAVAKGLVNRADLGRGSVVSITSRDVYRLIDAELRKDPAFLIVGKPGRGIGRPIIPK